MLATGMKVITRIVCTRKNGLSMSPFLLEAIAISVLNAKI